MPEDRARDGQEDQGSMWDRVKWMLLVFLITNGATTYLFGGQQPQQQQQQQQSASQQSSSAPAAKTVETTLQPLWQRPDRLNIELGVSGSSLSEYPEVTTVAVINDTSFEEGINVVKNIDIPVSKDFITNNGSLWAHLKVTNWDDSSVYHTVKPITRYMQQPKRTKKKHLIGDQEELDVDDPEHEPLIVPHYHPNISLAFVDTWDPILLSKTHPAAYQHMAGSVSPAREVAVDGHNLVGHYYPIVYNNEFWQLQSQMREINSTVTSIPFQFTVYQMKFWQFQLLSTFDFGLKQQAEQQAAGTAEIEEVKRVLLETNPILLGVTIAVSLLHTLFEFLAFKNDISHWKNKKDTIGVSVRTIVANVVMQLVIFLYLMDNSDNTNNMVLLTQGMGIFVEAWKITKAVDIKFNHNGKWIEVTDKHELTDTEKKTKEYDEIIFKYLYIIAVPLILAYAGYSLVYEQHKSWTSFCITVAVQCVYAYGFLLLIPPVYINYRLKSVAHMSTRAMIYKTLNTFIDDLFSFVIKMPWLHRIMTLRDDVVFMVYLYQSWAYRVDYKRVNELGIGPDEGEDVADADTKKDK